MGLRKSFVGRRGLAKKETILKYFDQIFVISLPNEVGDQRKKVLHSHMVEHGIEYTVWTGTELENGVVGLLCSMHGLLTWCIQNKMENVLICEDDNSWLIPFWPAMDEIWPQVPKEYHCLFLSCNLLSRPERVSQNILRIRSSYSTNAIVYSLEAMKLIMPLIRSNLTTAYDILLMKHIQPLGKTYCTIPMLSNQRAGYSSIEKKEIDWAEYQSQSFRMYTHNI
jgi:hypothetical protein